MAAIPASSDSNAWTQNADTGSVGGTGGNNTGTRALGGALSGASTGASVGGGYGAAAGAVIGLIGGLLGGKGGGGGTRISNSQSLGSTVSTNISVSPTIVNSFGGGTVDPNVGGASGSPYTPTSASSSAAGNDYLPTGVAGGIPLNPNLATLRGAQGQPIGTVLASFLNPTTILVGAGLLALVLFMPGLGKGK